MTYLLSHKERLLVFCVVSCALVVIVGWFANLHMLVQVLPGFAPMQFNTALCFLLISSSIILSDSPKLQVLSSATLSSCFALSVIALIEHLIGSNVGIDTLFIMPEVTDRTSFPGRMSVATALCFVCTSVACMGRRGNASESPWGSAALASFALSVAALIEYGFSLDPGQGHAVLVGMALHTTACHLFLSSALLSKKISVRNFTSNQLITLVCFACLCVTLSIFAWQQVLSLQVELQRQSLERDSRIRAELVRNEFLLTENIIEATKLFYLGSKYVDEGEFHEFVSALVKSDQTLMAVDWSPRVIHAERAKFEAVIQEKGQRSLRQLNEERKLIARRDSLLYFPVAYTYPNIEGGKAFGFDHFSDRLRAVAMDKAARENRLSVTTPFGLFRQANPNNSSTDVLFVAPVIKDKSETPIENARDPRVSGFIVGVVRTTTIIDRLFTGFEDTGLNVSLFFRDPAGEEIEAYRRYSRYNSSDETESGVQTVSSYDLDLQVADSIWRLRFSPTGYYLQNQMNSTSTLTLVLALLLGFMFVYYLASSFQAKRKALDDKKMLTKANGALREREEWFAQLSRASTVGIFRTDEEGSCVYVNEAWSKLTGIAFERAIGAGWVSAIHPDDREEVFERWQQTAGRGEPFQHEFRFVQPDGSVRWTVAASKPVLGDQKNVIGHIGTNFDLTEQKLSAEKIRELSTLQAAIINNAGYAIISGDVDGIITSFNPGAEEMLGYKAEELVGKHTPGIFHVEKEVRAKAKLLSQALGKKIEPGFEVFAEAARSDKESVAEWTYVRKDGSKLLVLLSITPISDESGETTGYLGMAVDITERSKLREKLERNLMKLELAKKAAESAAQAKAAFLANMSHEIRTPLTSVIGYAEQLLDSELDQYERTQFTHTIVQSSEHLLELLNDILDFSKLEAGKVEVNLDSTPLFELVDLVESAFRRKAEEKGITLDVEFNYPLPSLIETDSLRVKQVLINLISNSVKFTERGGVRLLVDYLKETQEIQFQVKDSGIGLTEEQIPKLFQDFSQADESTTKKFGGTGLGLSLSKKFVEMLKGRIRVESVYQVGSCFEVTLPAGDVSKDNIVQSRPDLISQEVVSSAAESLSGKILLVEDTKVNQKLFTRMLEKLGLEVELAENGQMGVEKVREGDFELVIMDMQMPVMDGYTATELLRQEKFAIPIIGCTADTSPSGRTRCLKVGCNDVITKPFSTRTLANLLETYLK